MTTPASTQVDTSDEQGYIPGTQVIKNLVNRDSDHPYGTSSQRILEQAETLRVSRRLEELHRAPLPTDTAFTFAHMRSIHQHLFQDVYAWAGRPRNVPMTKKGTGYAEPAQMAALLRHQYGQLAQEDYLRGINDAEVFASKLAEHWAEINHGHAFREGNTRTQTVFFAQLAGQAGWDLDVTRLSPHHEHSVYDQFVEARFAHQRCRGVPGTSAQEAAADLAAAFSPPITPGAGPEAALRRGEGAPDVSTAQRIADRHARYPELRDIHLDAGSTAPVILSGSATSSNDHELGG